MRMGLQICHLTCCILALSENTHNIDNLKHGFVDACLQNVMDWWGWAGGGGGGGGREP